MIDTDTLRHDREALLAELRNAGANVVKPNAIGCPFHDDTHPSAGVYQDDKGVWRFKCQAASCGFNGDVYDVLAKASGREVADVLRERSQAQATTGAAHKQPEREAPKIYGTLNDVLSAVRDCVAHYEYRNPVTRAIDMVVMRIEGAGKSKRFLQAHQQPAGWFVMQAPPKPWPIYNRARVASADRVVIVEGEKCVHALHDIGIVATTSPGGAGKAEHADWSPLAGKTVYLWPDADAPDPKTGRRTGIVHMRDVARKLGELDPGCSVYWIDPDRLGLADKEDAADYITQHADLDTDAMRLTVQSVLQDAEPLGPSGEVKSLLEDTISGRRSAIGWPWPAIGNMTRALLPGTVTIICGDPGAAKSFYLLQAAAYWHMSGVPVAIFEVEEDRAYHLMRALAQASRCSRFFDDQWVRSNPDEARSLFSEHVDYLDGFGRCIFDSQGTNVTLDQLAKWTAERAAGGARVIGIDPITAAAFSDKPWIDDLKFLMSVKDTARQFECSVVLVTHPRKGVKGGSHMEDMAGGAAYARFSQTIMWLTSHHPAIDIQVIDTGGFPGPSIEANKTLSIRKARNGRGGGYSIGYRFDGRSLLFDELGVVADG